MAHHKSAKKRIRQAESKKAYNRYYSKTMRNSLRSYRLLQDKEAVVVELPKLTSSLDKLVKRGIIHKNKAANLKSKIAKKANSL